MIAEFESAFDGERYEYITKAMNSSALDYHEGYDNNYTICRDKVSEITLARALSRPLKEQEVDGKMVRENRQDVIALAGTNVNRLKGITTAALGMHLSRFEKAQ